MNAATQSGPDRANQPDGAHPNPPEDAQQQALGVSPDLLAALTGREANRERAVAHRTRRVVMSSVGVLRERKQDKSRARALALAVAFVLLVLISPLVWEAVDSLVAGEHLGDPGNQLSMWACIVCSTLIAAALVAGWWRKRS